MAPTERLQSDTFLEKTNQPGSPMMVEQMPKDSKFEGGPFLCSWKQPTLKALTCPLHRKRCLKRPFC